MNFQEDDYKKIIEVSSMITDSDSMYGFGVIFEDGGHDIGDGIVSPQNYKLAAHFYNMGAEEGHASSQYSLGMMYVNGKGVAIDDELAAYWYLKAANQGHLRSQYSLGVIYEYGKGVAKDYVLSAHWYLKAAKQGDEEAQFCLGLLFAKGQGVLKDSVEAYAWWNNASAQGHADATKNRDLIEKEMSISQIEKAQELSKLYYENHVK